LGRRIATPVIDNVAHRFHIVMGDFDIRNKPLHMPTIDIEFSWYRHIAGYRLKDGRVVAKGDEVQGYRPLDDFSTLYKMFADQCRSEKGVIEFINKFGPLSTDPGELIQKKVLGLRGIFGTRGDRVRDVIDNAKLMNRQLAGAMIPQLPLTNIEAVLVPDVGTVRLKLSPSRLIDAIWLQMAQSISSGRDARSCKLCGIPFEVGPGSGRRLDAVFCCDEHRITFNSRARSIKP
jgi:hypothetical protein